VEYGLLERVVRGVYAVRSAPVSPFRAEQAAWLSLAPDKPAWARSKLDRDSGVISHRSATKLHGIGDFVANQVDIMVLRRRTTRLSSVSLHLGELDEHEVVLIDGLPVTNVERTVLDLLADHVDAGHVATVIRQGLETGGLDLDVLRSRTERYARRYGVKTRAGMSFLEYLLAHIGVEITDIATQDQRK